MIGFGVSQKKKKHCCEKKNRGYGKHNGIIAAGKIKKQTEHAGE
jgi:hypothetical protein